MPAHRPPQGYRFGPFEADLRSFELRKLGLRLRLERKPWQLLLALLERPGELVTRAELERRLWGPGVFVDFEHGVNVAVKKVREALCDSADAPRYIETVAGEGYRFLAPVDVIDKGPVSIPVPELVRSEPLEIPRPRRRWPWLAAAAVLVASGVALGIWWARPPAIAFQARDWVLISSFENRTSEPVFNGTLERALERDLSNSQFVNVAPPERIRDTLLLMKLPPETPLDARVAREVCLRDGAIRVLLAGTVEKLDSTYMLSVKLVDPAGGLVVAALSEEASTAKDVLPAIRRLSNRVRQTLGEHLPTLSAQGAQALAQVTTPSLRALQLYTQGEQSLREERNLEAEELFKQAVIEDSEFASAYIKLAWAIQYQGRPTSEYLPFAKRGFELSARASERERYIIQGGYYQLSGQDPKAVASYQTLLRRYPDDDWGVEILLRLYDRLGRAEESTSVVVHRAQLRPNDILANLEAAIALPVDPKGLEEAKIFLRRAAAITPAAGDSESIHAGTAVQLFAAHQAWLEDDVPRAQAELTRVERTNIPWRDTVWYPLDVGWFKVTLGQFREAEKYFESDSDPMWRSHALAQLAFLRGDIPTFRRHLDQIREAPSWSPLITLMMIRAGYLAGAKKRARSLERTGNAFSGAVFGELALARGDTSKGIALLEQEVAKSQSRRHPVSFLATESLAKVYRERNDLESAARVLTRMAQERNKLYYTENYSVYWMRIELQLAELYREMGRDQDAQSIESKLRKLLAYADPDHPMLSQLNSSQLARR